MIPEQEATNFKVELKRRGITIKIYCHAQGFSPNLFSQELNRHRPMQKKHLDAIGEYLKECAEEENSARLKKEE